MRRSTRHGMTLLEVLIALAVLATAGTAVLGLAVQSWDSVQSARSAEQSTTQASAFLEAVALWPREDLDRHLGERPQTPWRMRVERPLPTLYVVSLTDSSGRSTLLVTSLYRPEPARVR